MVDSVRGRPTGSVRISLGYMSTLRDVDTLVSVIRDNFVQDTNDDDDDDDPGDTRLVTVTGLHVYPVKSCAGMSVRRWRMTEGGLEWDRQWMVMQGSKVLTQKRDPLLSQIRTHLDLERKILTLSFRDERSVEVPFDSKATKKLFTSEVCVGNICGEEVQGYDCGQEAASFLEDILGVPGVRLVRGVKRRSQRSDMSSSLANDSSCLLLNDASINSLLGQVKTRCEKLGDDAVAFTADSLTQRFRGNIVVTGVQAFIEENFTRLSGDQVQLKVSGLCKRCQMIKVEQGTGEVTKEPLRSLAAMKNRNFNFGVHTRLETGSQGNGWISVGDVLKYI